MAREEYTDDKYARRTRDLRNTVQSLIDIDVDTADIIEIVEEAIADAE